MTGPNIIFSLFYIFIYFFGGTGSLLLRAGFLSLRQGGYCVAVLRLLIAVASLVAEHGLQGARASGVVPRGLGCSVPCGIFVP